MQLTDLFFRNMHLPHKYEDIGKGACYPVNMLCTAGGCRWMLPAPGLQEAAVSSRRNEGSHQCLPPAATPPACADLLFEELWRILGACFLTGAVTCYAVKVPAALVKFCWGAAAGLPLLLGSSWPMSAAAGGPACCKRHCCIPCRPRPI